MKPHGRSTTRVFVLQGSECYHADPDCESLRPPRGDDELGGSVGWCLASAAHRSCLRPCSSCATALGAELKAFWGSIPSGERHRLGLPSLHPSPHHPLPASSGLNAAIDVDPEAAAPYGPAEDLDDPRFVARTSAGWGMAAYGQDPDEFLGSTIDDDHDWRSASRYLD